VRVTVRERMVRWLCEQHPYALPRVNTADAAIPHSRHSPDGHRNGFRDGSRDGAVAGRASEAPRTGRG
jgi:hypothetical protein